MSYGYQGGRTNPYDQRGMPSPQYGAPHNAPAMGRDEYAASPGQNVEMEPLAQNGSQFGRQANPNAILNECQEISAGVKEIDAMLTALSTLQISSLDGVNTNAKRQVETMSADIMVMYRNLVGRVRQVKSQPESGSPRNAPQVGNVDRALKAAINRYQVLDSEFRKKLEEQAARQYRIVRPDATESEVRQAIQEPSAQMFSQALMQSDRRGQSQSTMTAVTDRHAAIQKIEQQMIELAELFQDMDVLVVQQEAAVVNIEMKGEEVVENMDKGTEQIGVAVQSARNARKWKWWCLGIVVLIIVIIVIVVLIYKFVIQNNATTTTTTKAAKRWVLTDSIPAEKLSAAGHRVIQGQPFTPSSKVMVPGLTWSEDNTLVTDAPVRKMRSFVA